jgi:hypothetical protein
VLAANDASAIAATDFASGRAIKLVIATSFTWTLEPVSRREHKHPRIQTDAVVLLRAASL